MFRFRDLGSTMMVVLYCAALIGLLAAATQHTSCTRTLFDDILAKDKSIVKLQSGLMIKVLSNNYNKNKGTPELPDALESGGQRKSPRPQDAVELHWKGYQWDLDGNQVLFEDTREDGPPLPDENAQQAPQVVKPRQLASGFSEALELMREGDKWMIYVPQELGYGAQGRPPTIGPFEPIGFEIELLRVLSVGKSEEEAAEEFKRRSGGISYDSLL